MVEQAPAPRASAARVDQRQEAEPDSAPVVAGVGPGMGIADARGRVLWVDDALCFILRRSRDELVGDGLAKVLSLDPGESAVVQRVTPVTDQRGHPWAFVVELEIS